MKKEVERGRHEVCKRHRKGKRREGRGKGLIGKERQAIGGCVPQLHS